MRSPLLLPVTFFGSCLPILTVGFTFHHQIPSKTAAASTTHLQSIPNHHPSPSHHPPDADRRHFLLTTAAAVTASSCFPFPAFADLSPASPDAPAAVVSVDRLADLLRPVPVFAIVDPSGVPFMVFGEDAKVTGYFFTTYAEARRILDLASGSAEETIREARRKKEKDAGANPWKGARVSSVPLDLAVTLASRRVAGNRFQIAPAEEDVEDALAVQNSGAASLAEGKVPLFYFADFKNSDGRSPLYFRKSELLEAWAEARPADNATPPVLVTELFAVLTKMVQPGADKDLQTIVFVPPKESDARAKECLKKQLKTASPYVIGQRIVVL